MAKETRLTSMAKETRLTELREMIERGFKAVPILIKPF
jgi:hypothetical protein